MDSNAIVKLFSATYQQARQKFRLAADRRGLPIASYVLPIAGAEGEELAIDVVLDGLADAPNLLVTISGVHGVEGFCGSAIQSGMIEVQPLEEAASADTAVLHVHAVNPYGFSHLRRVTQENVDLNRNFVDFGAALPENPGYAQIHDLLLPRDWPPPGETEDRLGAFRAEHGARGFQRAVSLGQYAFPDGMFFGGVEPTWSNLTFRKILRRHASSSRNLASIDFHTGLGPYGVGERIFACPEDPVVFARASQWWGKLTSVETGTSSSIPLTGPIQTALSEECPDAQQTHICLEYGTLPGAQMSAALRAEHWLHRHGGKDAPVASEIRSTLKVAFFPDAEDWKLTVWNQGREACEQAIAGLRSSGKSAALAPSAPNVGSEKPTL